MKSCSSEMEIAVPGDRLGNAKEIKSGLGTYTIGGIVYASVVGQKAVSTLEDGTLKVDVVREKRATVLPGVGDLVTARVTKINARYAMLEILFTEGQILRDSFPGMIRARDVRAFDVDTVQIYDSFRPGDIVRAEVLSLGDSKSYYLSTAKNELGVIGANSSAGHSMVPISWNQMQCPVTKRKEMRKVAKISK
uniref:S1 motif domain-containing protein n=1 Tax=Norrisiella sphaerica TaxID=552664 RepID=A0A7S2VUI8_9EUKA|mmetsp:Transcript_1599/g.2295  ORF Transcript_1599/g.2295 Transcript_1599/m.2295 type:complete len:193 (+) Transcript_1599:18-596(+)